MVKTKTEQAIIDALEAVAPQHDVDIVDVELVGATKAPCVRVLTSTATVGRRKYTGKIAAATETNVTLELEDGESVTLDFCDVKKCKLKPSYDFKPAKEGK